MNDSEHLCNAQRRAKRRACEESSSYQIGLPRLSSKLILGRTCQVYSFGIVILELLTAMQPAKLTQVGGSEQKMYGFRDLMDEIITTSW